MAGTDTEVVLKDVNKNTNRGLGKYTSGGNRRLVDTERCLSRQISGQTQGSTGEQRHTWLRQGLKKTQEKTKPAGMW